MVTGIPMVSVVPTGTVPKLTLAGAAMPDELVAAATRPAAASVMVAMRTTRRRTDCRMVKSPDLIDMRFAEFGTAVQDGQLGRVRRSGGVAGSQSQRS